MCHLLEPESRLISSQSSRKLLDFMAFERILSGRVGGAGVLSEFSEGKKSTSGRGLGGFGGGGICDSFWFQNHLIIGQQFE